MSNFIRKANSQDIISIDKILYIRKRNNTIYIILSPNEDDTIEWKFNTEEEANEIFYKLENKLKVEIL